MGTSPYRCSQRFRSSPRWSPSAVSSARLGKLTAANVPIVVQKTDDSSYGAGLDGLLGMSFLSRFEVQMTDGFIEVRTRRRK